MPVIMDHPLLFFPLVFALLYLAGRFGMWLPARNQSAVTSASFKTLESAVLGLLALLLGFSFAMAVNHFDLRKDLEVEEANAIGTTWLRTSTLDDAMEKNARVLLRQYVPLRLEFFSAGNDRRAIADSLARAGAVQTELWQVATDRAQERRDAYSTLYAAALNSMIDVTEKRTAAFENRIPAAAWVLLIFIAAAASVLVGIGNTARSRSLLVVLPLVVGAALMLIQDLDSPRSGFVKIPQNSMQRVAVQINTTSR